MLFLYLSLNSLIVDKIVVSVFDLASAMQSLVGDCRVSVVHDHDEQHCTYRLNLRIIL